MKEKLERIKNHIYEHREAYITGAICVVVTASFTAAIMRGNSLGGRIRRPKGDADSTDMYRTNSQTIISSPFSNSFNTVNNTVNNTNVSDANRLSYITSLDGTDYWWISQADASRETGIPEPALSKHINHGMPLARGMSFTRRGIAA